MEVERDPITGRNTTGHEWDGIKELDSPIPKLVIFFYVTTFLLSVAIWYLYPAWPFVTDFTRGVLGYSSRTDVSKQIEMARHQKSAVERDLVAADLDTLANKTQIRKKYQKSISILYRDNCAACHGQNLKGQRGFPNLTDKHWLWSGKPGEIEKTIAVGINAKHYDTRVAEMLGFGRLEVLSASQVADVVEYVLSISGQKHDTAMSTKGAAIFKEHCTSCHGAAGKGGMKIGAPSLIDDAWIYGATKDAIRDSVWNGRKGVMPAWSDRLTNDDIRKLTLYVMWQGNAGSK